MEEGLENGETISVEAKKFSFFQTIKGFVLKEYHNKGERFLHLTENQSKWIQQGLFYRSQRFGETRRIESKAIDGETAVISEGSNKNGCFISIYFKGNQEDSSFLIILSGFKGAQWVRVAKLIGNQWRSSGNQTEGNRKSQDPIRSGKSYVDAVMYDLHEKEDYGIANSVFQRVEILEKDVSALRSTQDNLKKSLSSISDADLCDLVSRIELLEREVQILRQEQIRPAPAAVSNPNTMGKKGGSIDEISSDPTSKESPRPFPIQTTCTNPSLIPAELFGIFIKLSKDLERAVSRASSLGPELAISESVPVAVTVRDTELLECVETENGIVEKSNQKEDEKSNDDIDTEVTHVSKNDSSCGKQSSSSHQIINSDAGEVSELVKLDDISGGNDTSSSTEYKSSSVSTLGSTEEESREDEDSYVDAYEIYWDDKYECYAHSCGMRYEPQTSTYFAEVSGETDDLRCFYFVPKQEKLKLAYKGRRGDINKEILSDKGWDWSTISNSLCFPPDIIELFRNKIIGDELCGM